MYIPNKQLKASSRVGLQMTRLAWVHSILATKENPNNFPNLFILGWRVGAFENKVSRGRESVLSRVYSDFKICLEEERSATKIEASLPQTRHERLCPQCETSELRVRSFLRSPGPTSCL